MSFENKRDLWFVSGNKAKGDIYAIPVVDLEDGAEIISDAIARLADNDVDGARRWVVVADSGEEAFNKLLEYVRATEAITLQEAAKEFGLAYRTFQGAAKDGRLSAWQSGSTWLTTRKAIQSAIDDGKLRPRKEVI